MLGTLIKALEVDFRNADNEKYLRSATNLRQTLSRILSIRKHYPEFKAVKPGMFPKLTQISKLSKSEGLCLTYWHDCGEISEFRAVLGNKTEATEAALLASRPSRFKTASLSHFMQRSEDKVLLSYLTDVSRTTGSNESKRVFNTQAHRQQVTGLLYQLHLLERQLQTMIARHSQNLDFSPQISFAPLSVSKAHNKAGKQFVDKDFVVPISFDNLQPPIHQHSGLSQVQQTTQGSTIQQSVRQTNFNNGRSFDTTGPLDIWYSLAEDPRTPYRFLVWLSENHNPYVSQRALATLQKHKQSQQSQQAQTQSQQVQSPAPPQSQSQQTQSQQTQSQHSPFSPPHASEEWQQTDQPLPSQQTRPVQFPTPPVEPQPGQPTPTSHYVLPPMAALVS